MDQQVSLHIVSLNAYLQLSGRKQPSTYDFRHHFHQILDDEQLKDFVTFADSPSIAAINDEDRLGEDSIIAVADKEVSRGKDCNHLQASSISNENWKYTCVIILIAQVDLPLSLNNNIPPEALVASPFCQSCFAQYK